MEGTVLALVECAATMDLPAFLHMMHVRVVSTAESYINDRFILARSQIMDHKDHRDTLNTSRETAGGHETGNRCPTCVFVYLFV
jgi:hypothetical protein